MPFAGYRSDYAARRIVGLAPVVLPGGVARAVAYYAGSPSVPSSWGLAVPTSQSAPWAWRTGIPVWHMVLLGLFPLGTGAVHTGAAVRGHVG